MIPEPAAATVFLVSKFLSSGTTRNLLLGREMLGEVQFFARLYLEAKTQIASMDGNKHHECVSDGEIFQGFRSEAANAP